ncbi:MAG: GT4 family glycosyltransferase PelF, partial [Polaromonas sp.]|nr:GT4 family glycosyltransferase PelF [Polaromonas sp.]
MPQYSSSADITLLLEGSYPFVRGGVSAWVHALIEGLPDISFSLVHLGAEKTADEQVRYKLPPNVRDLQCHYLVGDIELGKPQAQDGDAAFFSASDRLHKWFREPDGVPDGRCLDQVVVQKGRCEAAGANDFFYSKAAWKQICDSYS